MINYCNFIGELRGLRLLQVLDLQALFREILRWFDALPVS